VGLLNFEKAGWIEHHQFLALAANCDPRLAPVVFPFAENISRFESAWLLPPYLVDTSQKNVEVSLIALHNILGTLDTKDPRLKDEAIETKVQEEFLRLVLERLGKIHETETRDDSLNVALGALNALLENCPPLIIKGIKTILESQIVTAWTAVECCAKDLWELAVNIGPRDWTDRVMRRGKYRGEKEHEKSIPISRLDDVGYDLRLKMGTISKERIQFETLDEVLAAYCVIFGDEIKTLYAPFLQGTLALEATRNVLVHRAGIVDRKSLGKIKRTSFFPEAEIGKKLEIDGEVVGKLTSDGLHLAEILIGIVDPKIRQHDPNA
jgi:hypothetical protein